MTTIEQHKGEQNGNYRAHPNGQQPAAHTLIIGGAGFIGSNLADTLLRQGRHVLIFDSLARPGVQRNLRWLQRCHGSRLLVQIDDLRNQAALGQAIDGADAVFHLGAQVAVTTSLDDPIADFEVNAQGTLNLLETLRRQAPTIPLLFTSTNKVYGNLADLQLTATESRYQPASKEWRHRGISEQRTLAFHSPYGCSKGTADQYVLDYAHSFGLPTALFRMSCIYGPRQFGTEDQGWLAHFLIRALTGEPITIYGDGKQVRDVLYVDDLIRALLLAEANIATIQGEAFNMGGGPANTISLLELLDLIEQLHGQPVARHFADWRPGDQRWYVSDSRKFSAATGWQATVDVQAGLVRLYGWISELCQTAAPRTAVRSLPASGRDGEDRAITRRAAHPRTSPSAANGDSNAATRREFVHGD
jgi:CDP-paratose 2-epimerase